MPIVVAKCGVFLKEKGSCAFPILRELQRLLTNASATGIEGIFRLSGSEKRIKELKQSFDSPDRYGKGLVWDGYTVHDAANVLRRYLNDLPEPVVPLGLYEKFRDPLRGATKHTTGEVEGPQFVDSFDELAAIETYQQLITELPPLNRQLLLYILDLLAVFAAKADENRMNSQNLAAIFQPGMLSHPSHAMAPEEYRLNQCVLIFLIENQDHFLIGMQGTAADEKTKKEVESGTPTTPNPKGVERTASNASAAANSVRRDGQLRRNRSVSSKHSRNEGSVGSNSPSLVTTPTGGLGRSNTVPSKKSPALAGAKFRKTDSPGHHSPARVEPMTPVRQASVLSEADDSSQSPAAIGATNIPSQTRQASGPSQERLLEVPQDSTSTPAKERNLQSLFQRSPTETSEKRQPNKLKKKRIPGSVNISAHSSNASLPHSNAASPAFEAPNPMEHMHPMSERVTSDAPQPSNVTSEPAPVSIAADIVPAKPDSQSQPSPGLTEHGAAELKPSIPHQTSHLSSELTPRASPFVPNDNLRPEDNGTNKSSASVHSLNDGSDADVAAEGQAFTQTENDKEKKKRWRLSRTKKDDPSGSSSSLPSPPQVKIGTNANAETSTTTIGSHGSRPRKSFTQEGPDPALAELQSGHDSGKESKDDSKGPLGWIKHKYREAKENAEQRRNKSPPATDRQRIGAALIPRGRSLDMKREKPEEENSGEKASHKAEAPTGESNDTSSATEGARQGLTDQPAAAADQNTPAVVAGQDAATSAPTVAPTDEATTKSSTDQPVPETTGTNDSPSRETPKAE